MLFSLSNPWLRQTKRIDAVVQEFFLCGTGYNSSRPEKSYKIVGFTSYFNELRTDYLKFAMFEFATNAWKIIDHASYVAKSTREQSLRYNNVSLNGNLYWPAYNLETCQYFIQILDFSEEIMKPFCIQPCEKKDSSYTRVLAVYKGERFSLLEQCKTTCKIEVWVTKKKITNGDDGEDVVWIKFMNVSIHNFPRFYHKFSRYMVDNNIYGKTLVMCCSYRKNDQAYVYIVRGDMCKRIKIDEVPSQFRWSIHVPSLIVFR
ncbi:unnamed protein product [Arabidopsis lyrata]|uniref:F-box associated beta-propeller type 1 domain-containing protein n=1 Tax=Arabidopsis lyrata subsp. lyrata TaxID=81972 RepID=D7KYK8_ARALL|nr:hypothetical protein ARALYDRAFT_893732 [Arabidopsis lyrata subsp. lyrata]CAH8256570.1 unnamed protein product [Arabidopsis lyrata]